MTILGLTLDTITLAQIITTVVILSIYATIQSLNLGEAYFSNRKRVILLCDFAIRYHKEIDSIESIFNHDGKIFEDTSMDSYRLTVDYNEFRESGAFLFKKYGPEINIVEQIIMLIISPFFNTWFSCREISRSFKYRRLYLTRSTELRKNYSSMTALAFAPSLPLFIWGLYLLNHNSNIWGYLILALGIINAVTSIATICFFVWEQIKWKNYWREKIIDIMGDAAHEENHDLFNRAGIMMEQVSSEPDIPIPANLTFYGIVISTVNFLIPRLLAN